MKFRGVILLLGSVWFVAVLLAQNSFGRSALRSLGGQTGTQPAQAASACSAASECGGAGVEYRRRRPNHKPILRPFACCQA